ncbi:hypothetical protein CFP56_009580 [Quercus suber]|uniref:Uncharacterized protein n=1 Tax=Quercus suber TaxID=58331 RepID=A0AAW0M7B3_QUESU
MGSCSKYGIMMEKLHMKKSLRSHRTLTLDIALEQKLHRLEAKDPTFDMSFKNEKAVLIEWSQFMK